MADANDTPKEDDVLFTLRHWGSQSQAPTPEQLADELERIAGMIRDDFTSGEALKDEDVAGTGWWAVHAALS